MVYIAAMDASRAGGNRFAIRNNARIACDPGKLADAVGDPTIVLLGDRNAFAAQRAALGADGRIIASDARGHGASATLANQWYTVAELALDLLAILDLDEVSQAHIVEHGPGGATIATSIVST